jgi:hypothetical protein
LPVVGGLVAVERRKAPFRQKFTNFVNNVKRVVVITALYMPGGANRRHKDWTDFIGLRWNRWK